MTQITTVAIHAIRESGTRVFWRLWWQNPR
jgi:hypothetical protein